MIEKGGPAGKPAGQGPALTLLGGLADVSAQRFPSDSVALRYPVGSSWAQLTYPQLASAVHKCAKQLAGMGVHAGDVLGLQMPNRVEFVVALFGAAKVGAAVALLEDGQPTDECQILLRQVGARALMVCPSTDNETSTKVPGLIPQIICGYTEQRHSVAVSIQSGARRLARPVPSGSLLVPTDTALILYTSGTTGTPKAVPLNDTNIFASIQDIISTLRLSECDATLAAMPLFHGHGLFATLLATITSGGTLTLPHKGRFSATFFWADMAAAGATWYTGTPTMHQIILSQAETLPKKPDIPKLRFVRSCSAALSPRVAQELGGLVQAPVVQAYGQTETSHQTASVYPGDPECLHESTVGHPTGVELLIVDEEGTPVPHGNSGEIIVRGPTVMLGYVGGNNSPHFFGDWYRTGDVGVFDQDGKLSLVGRIKEIINRGGEKISPTQVDLALLANPEVNQACAFAVPDSLYGQQVGAAIVAKPNSGLTPQQVIDSVTPHLEKAAVPVELFFVDSIPQTPKGTADRKKVEAMYQAGDLGTPVLSRTDTRGETTHGDTTQLEAASQVDNHESDTREAQTTSA